MKSCRGYRSTGLSRSWPVFVLLAFLSWTAASAQDPEDQPPPPDRPESPPPPGHGPGFGHGRHGGGNSENSPVDRWLEHVRESNPEEYRRLTELKTGDPEAFRRELRDRLRKKRAMNMLEGRPHLAEAIRGLPPEEQSWLADRILDRPGRGPGPGDPETQQALKEHYRSVRTGMQTYRAAETPEEKDAARGEIRTTLSEIFDLKEEQRRERIAQAEELLQRLKREFDDLANDRDEVIDRELEELLRDGGRNRR